MWFLGGFSSAVYGGDCFLFLFSQIKYWQQKLESAVKETEIVKKSSDRSKALDALRDENTAFKVRFCMHSTPLLWSSQV